MIHFHICEVKVGGNGLGVCVGGVLAPKGG